MNKLTIVDTDILIDAGLEISEAVDCLDKIEKRSLLAIRVITKMELFVGCLNKTELRKTERFLRRFHIVKLNEQISDTASNLLYQYRLSHNLAIPDALIAAAAMTLYEDFITKNQRDYCFINGLRLLSYPFTITK